MSSIPKLCWEFDRQAKIFFAQNPQIKHILTLDADEVRCELEIPLQSEGGFPISVIVHPEEVTVTAGGAHTNEPFSGNDPAGFIGHVLGYVWDLLSPVMRIRERLAGGHPHEWIFELKQNGIWQEEERVGLIFWNWIGKRSEVLYQNNVLPVRDNPVEQVHPPLVKEVDLKP